MKTVLILSDFVGLGNVAMATTRAILTRMGCRTLCLPTALISNTWNLGPSIQLDTTDYLTRALDNWDAMGIRFDAVFIGYLSGPEQAEVIAARCPAWRQQGAMLLLDPILADNGRLYNGITPQQVDAMRRIARECTWLLPNATEATFLAGGDPRLTDLGAANVLITGADPDGHPGVVLWDGKTRTVLPYDPIPGSFSGTGDAFSALFLGGLLQGLDAVQSAQSAMATTAEYIQNTLIHPWPDTGLPVEQYFS